MPYLSSYGLTVTLNTPDYPLPESPVQSTWIPSASQTHPIYASTALAPATPQPLTITVHLSDSPLPEHLAGDLRVEVLLNSIPIGLKVLREVKVRGKGFTAVFSGFRIGRTEERGLIVHDPSPKTTHKTPLLIPNIGAAWTNNTVESTTYGDLQEGDCPCMLPRYPKGVPDGVGVIQVLVTVGKKFQTLEKYFMQGATQYTAFYAQPSLFTGLEPKAWKPPARGDHAGLSSSSGKAVLKDGGLSELDKGTIRVGKIVQKTVQVKEVEFAARLHMARVWIFVVPRSVLPPPPPPPKPSLKVVLKMSPNRMATLTEQITANDEIVVEDTSPTTEQMSAQKKTAAESPVTPTSPPLSSVPSYTNSTLNSTLNSPSEVGLDDDMNIDSAESMAARWAANFLTHNPGHFHPNNIQESEEGTDTLPENINESDGNLLPDAVNDIAMSDLPEMINVSSDDESSDDDSNCPPSPTYLHEHTVPGRTRSDTKPRHATGGKGINRGIAH